MNPQAQVETLQPCPHGKYYPDFDSCPACEQAKEEADHAAREEKYIAEAREAAQRRYERLRPHYLAIVDAVKGITYDGKDHMATFNDNILQVDGVRVDAYLVFREEYSRGSSVFRSKPNGHWRMTVGDYGNRVAYPQKKGGGFNYDAAAGQLVRIANKMNEASRMHTIRDSNVPAVAKLLKRLPLRQFYDPLSAEPSSVADKPVFARLKIEQAMTVEQFEELYNVLKKLGYFN